MQFSIVGENANTMNSRSKGHENSMRTARTHPVAIIYTSHNHIFNNLSISIIDKGDDNACRLDEKRCVVPGKFYN